MGGGREHVPVRHTDPMQQSLVAVHAPPCATHIPTGGAAPQWRVGGSVTGVSSRQSAVFGLVSPPQQSSSTSQVLALPVPFEWQPSSTQKPRSLMKPDPAFACTA